MFGRREEVLTAAAGVAAVSMICGETGSGKTTQVRRDEHAGVHGVIIVMKMMP